MSFTAIELAGRIDHTLLKPETTPEQIDQLCDDAVRYQFRGVCVNPTYIHRAVQRLRGRRAPHYPKVISVVSFPSGSNSTSSKVEEATRSLGDGALEIDMVANIERLLAGDVAAVRAEIEAVAGAVHRDGNLLKVIVETAALNESQLIAACRCCAEGEADFVKTSTGFHPAGGATVEAVRMLHRYSAPLKVKAAGGIRDLSTALAMIAAGASRIGTSSSPAIIEELIRPQS